ncbi:diaminopropionate ammonia-lyase [Sporolactobacillus spathodeae]|uniref:Diaminopropionate ammonia-lyase n=1 Tax=Sporolactobacillus spathodeae TaxID=1465502 RepID=A0ABS2Q8B5_9BACL|nr:diaminopropionate ammonia-lyase [Sporolactobacillus spathodeae]MBM7658027.1 diaminopropionate ammonia-lyase [Sporolactobacillus spathodeae]
MDNLRMEKNKRFREQVDAGDLMNFQESVIQRVLTFQKSHANYQETPLVLLKELAKQLKLSKLLVKDESYRFGLNAFKVMGGIYAVACCLAEQLGRSLDALTFKDLKAEVEEKKLTGMTFISATDGNHGRGVAWVTRQFGMNCIIRMPKGSSLERLKAIRAEGADAEITNVNYDDTVRICSRMAIENNYVMIQDTAWPSYEKIPLWIMQGYAGIAKEIAGVLDAPPTHIFLQAGVGSYAGGIAAYFLRRYIDNPPKIIIVEPNQADCYFRSFAREDGAMETVSGDMATFMAGLACGEPNTYAFHLLSRYASGAVSCSDAVTALGMRILGNPLKGDSRIISGESGAVTTGALYLLCSNDDYRKQFGLGEESVVLLISTEGDTDQASYREIVWEGQHPLKRRD